MKELNIKIKEAVKFIQSKTDVEPKIGVILGTGLGGFAKSIDIKNTIHYKDIPHFPVSTVDSHAGEFLCGNVAGKPIVAMQGRFHYYEGYTLEQVTFPVRIMKALGIDILIVSNAAGGLNPLYNKGDLVIINDHINFMGVNPLIGPNDDDLGPRFPDMCEPYNRDLIAQAEEAALEEKIDIKKGTYIGVTGPCLETAAEYRFMHLIGADLVGMSTIPEVIVGVHAGLKIFGISCVTDLCLPDALKPVDIKEIIETANNAEPKLNKVIARLIKAVATSVLPPGDVPLTRGI